jgi:hypothetical protein
MFQARLAFSLTFLFSLSAIALAEEGLRFAAPPGVVQMRVEVVSAGGGKTLYDSGWTNGNVLDWATPVLEYGSYGVRIHSRDLEGRASEQQTTLHVAPEGMSIDSAGNDLKLTTTLHDGQTGLLVTTSGDLSFRFGDFLHRKDAEKMRLTAEGKLGDRN